jgi:hypothetical protein
VIGRLAVGAAEWAYMTYGNCRITVLDQLGRSRRPSRGVAALDADVACALGLPPIPNYDLSIFQKISDTDEMRQPGIPQTGAARVPSEVRIKAPRFCIAILQKILLRYSRTIEELRNREAPQTLRVARRHRPRSPTLSANVAPIRKPVA